MRVIVFFQAEDGIRYLVRSRGLGDVYERQVPDPEERVCSGEIRQRRRETKRVDNRPGWSRARRRGS